MNIYFLIAGILSFLLGIVHSILGEYLIFNPKRKKGKLVPSIASANLKERHLRIIWATWHLASLFGWCLGFILVKISMEHDALSSHSLDFLVQSIMFTMLLSALLVFVGTKGKHPGWTVLLINAILLFFGN